MVPLLAAQQKPFAGQGLLLNFFERDQERERKERKPKGRSKYGLCVSTNVSCCSETQHKGPPISLSLNSTCNSLKFYQWSNQSCRVSGSDRTAGVEQWRLTQLTKSLLPLNARERSRKARQQCLFVYLRVKKGERRKETGFKCEFWQGLDRVLLLPLGLI